MTCFAALLLALPIAADEEAFLARLQEIQAGMEARRWEESAAALETLVQDHRGEPYVLRHYETVVETVRRCAFWMQTEVPELDEVISGEVESYSRRKGRVALRYVPGKLGDFIENEEDEWFLHPLSMQGTYEIKIRCEDYGGGFLPYIVLAGGSDDPVLVDAVLEGAPEGEKVTAYIAEWSDRHERWEQVVSKDYRSPKRGKAMTLRVVVNSKLVALYLGGKKLVTTRRDQPVEGYVRFFALDRPWSEIELSGETDGLWLDERLDAALGERRAAFDAEFDPRDYLPAWLFEGSNLDEPEKEDRWSWPPVSDPALRDRLAKFDEIETTRDIRDLLRELESAEDAAAAWYGRALLLLALDDEFGALEAAERAVELAPEHRPTRLFRDRLYARVGRAEDAIYDMESLWMEELDADVVSALAFVHLGERDLDRAQEVLNTAIDEGLHPSRLTEVQGLLTKARLGPRWPKVFEHRSRNYVVRSDVSEKLCIQAARHLEESFSRFRRDLVTFSAKERQAVYLFRGESGYLDYMEGIWARRENTAGVYLSVLDQILVWQLDDRDQMFRTLRHEAFHQYLDDLVPTPPTWFTEGLAEYYEEIELVDGKWRQGLANPRHLRVLRNTRLPSLKKLVFGSASAFYARPEVSYPQAWGFVNFLLHAPGKHKALFRGLLDALRAGKAPDEAVQEVFGDVDWDALEVAFRLHIHSLRAQGR